MSLAGEEAVHRLGGRVLPSTLSRLHAAVGRTLVAGGAALLAGHSDPVVALEGASTLDAIARATEERIHRQLEQQERNR